MDRKCSAVAAGTFKSRRRNDASCGKSLARFPRGWTACFRRLMVLDYELSDAQLDDCFD